MPNSNFNVEQTINILIIILGCIIFFMLVIGSLEFLRRSKKKAKQENDLITLKEESKSKVPVKQYNKQSVFKFMEFDKVEDNMIVIKDGAKYIMVVECQGINYDLMSNAEKLGVEEGFIQFLNTLRHPIQIYTQTRTINLEDSIQNYKGKVEEIDQQLQAKQQQFEEMRNSGRYTEEDLNGALFELTKQKNLYEYGKDIIYNTEKMSLNRNVLRKQYYIVIPYYPADLGNTSFDKEEIKNIAFQELYTKGQSLIRTLATFGVNGRIMDSYELVDLLYVAYNRDESETYGLGKAILAGYDELYSTAPDILDKKMDEINRQIDEKAIELANANVLKAQSEEEQTVDELQRNLDELIRERAKLILEENKQYIGEDIAERASEMIDQEEVEAVEEPEEKPKKTTRKRKSPKSVEGGNEDVGEEKERTRRTRAV